MALVAPIPGNPPRIPRRKRPKTEPVPAGQHHLQREHLLHSLQEHGATVTQVRFIVNDKFFATASHDQTVNVHDVSTGACLYTLPINCKGVRFHQMADDLHLVTTAKNNLISVWSLAGGDCVSQLQAGRPVPPPRPNVYDARTTTVSPGGGIMCSAHHGTVVAWETANGTLLNQLDTKCDLRIRDMVVSACGRMVAIAGEELIGGGIREGGSVRPYVTVWWVATGKVENINVDPDGTKAKIKSVAIKCIDISADGGFVAVASGSPLDFYAHVWDVQTKLEAAALKHNGSVWCLRLVPKCSWLVTGAAGKSDRVRIWDWRRQECLGQLGSGTGGITCLAINQARTVLAAGHQHGASKLWDLSRFKVKLYGVKWALILSRQLKLQDRSEPRPPTNIISFLGKRPAKRALEWLLNLDFDCVFIHIVQYLH